MIPISTNLDFHGTDRNSHLSVQGVIPTADKSLLFGRSDQCNRNRENRKNALNGRIAQQQKDPKLMPHIFQVGHSDLPIIAEMKRL